VAALAWVALLAPLAGTGATAQTASTEVFQFAAEVPVAVDISLWPLGINRGRDAPVFHNFMAQVRFSGEPDVLTCALRMPEADSVLQPGSSAELAIKCLLPFQVAAGQPEFRLYAGGKPIGQGRLRAAALNQVMSSSPPQPD
jgi:hypothetical protein